MQEQELDEQSSPLTHAIIGAAFEVHRALGPGFLERAYQEALALELEARGIPHERERAVPIFYKARRLATTYRCDFLVEGILLELKAQASLSVVDEAQLLHYLRATDLHTGLVLNFGMPSLAIRRMTNRRASPKSP